MSGMITEKIVRMETLDPLHVGIGRDRIGRVDLPIARNPATNLPKVPGTAINGACRHFADLRLRMAGKQSISAGQTFQPKEEQLGNGSKRLTPKYCPVCLSFGFTDENTGAQEGFLSFSDARIMMFPVLTHRGTTWVTTLRRLKDFLQAEINISEAQLPVSDLGEANEKLDLGWYLTTLKANQTFREINRDNFPSTLEKYPRNRITVVEEKIFTFVVNDNLEVRTSVSIDPETGAVDPDKGALFSYEAIPRGTLLAFSVGLRPDWGKYFEDAYREFDPCMWFPENKDAELNKRWPNNKNYTPWSILGLAGDGLKKLGLGGMTTRGFGRLHWDFQEVT